MREGWRRGGGGRGGGEGEEEEERLHLLHGLHHCWLAGPELDEGNMGLHRGEGATEGLGGLLEWTVWMVPITQMDGAPNNTLECQT